MDDRRLVSTISAGVMLCTGRRSPGAGIDPSAAPKMKTSMRWSSRARASPRAPVSSPSRPSTCCQAEALELAGHHRARRSTGHRGALAEFPAPVDHRRHGSRPPGHAARPRAGSDPGAGEQQASPPVGTGQRKRIDRARLGGGGSERHSARGGRNRRSAARRRLGAIRLRCHRRRHQSASARCA